MNPMVLNQAMYGFMMSHVLFTCDEMDVFERATSERGERAEELARLTGATVNGMERLLLAAVAAGLLEKHGDRFRVPGALRPYLQKGSPDYLGKHFHHFKQMTMRTFEHLKDGLYEGKPQWGKVFDKQGDLDIFGEIYADPARLKAFVESMWTIGIGPARELMKAYSLDGVEHLVDVGGCSGSLAIAALERHPRLRATVFDLPKVQPFLEARRAEFGFESRLSFHAGDFFVDPLPPADAYALGYILSDWSRERGTQLLRKLYQALPRGGRILIFEKHFNRDKTGPLPTAMMNLVMFLETYGQHYSAEEYMSWLREVGFNEVDVVTSSGDKHLVAARK